MKHYLTEKQVLKKLGIPNFRHLSKDNIIKFASMIPDMEVEVAKKALDQFPNLAKTSLEVAKSYESIIKDTINSNNESTQQCYAVYNSIMCSLEKMLEKGDDLSSEEKSIIISHMIDIAKMTSAKDTENKRFLAGVITSVCVVVLSMTAMLTSLLGAKIELPCKSDSDGNEDKDEDDEDK